MKLSDLIHRRKDRKTCDVCGSKFGSFEEMEVHRRNLHSEAI